MGTTLTGTTPQDTYDSLIKVTDNGPLSGTAKFLSDGLGNDSVLALSTTALGVGTATPVSRVEILGTKADLTSIANFQMGLVVDDNTSLAEGIGGGISFRGIRVSPSSYSTFAAIDGFKENATSGNYNGALRFLTASSSEGYPVERMRITSAGNVGIGTSAFDFWGFGNFGGTPITQKLATANTTDSVGVAVGSSTSSINFATLNATSSLTNINRIVSITTATTNNGEAGHLEFFTKSGATSTPSAIRLRVDQDGLKFNGDTAAANALDDYEEGTWTPSLGGNTTYSAQGGTYTKIGRQVTVHFVLGVTTLGTGSAANITGLPFTSFSSNRGAGGVAFVDAPSTGYASINPFALTSSTTLAFVTSTILGVWADQSNVFTDGTTISGTVTYFV
jgi:hypothetical protein